LPRIAHSREDFDIITNMVNSPANALCLCSGSLGSDRSNDIPAIIEHFGKKDRVACVHVRNVKHLGDKRFRESAHLSSEGDLDMYKIMKAIYDTCPDVYIRPDHGRMIWDEKARPGYGLYDRALGATYLEGLWEGIEKS
jgi:mannonate dehydratase